MMIGAPGYASWLGPGLTFVPLSPTQYLDPCTFNQEQCLHNRFLDHKVLLSQGKACLSPKPGWFCLVFAKDQLELKLGESG